MKSRVTTTRGDKGMTSTIAGDKYPKSHPVIACSGAVDSLRAHTALCRMSILESAHPQREEVAEALLWLLHTYFLVGSQCSDPYDKKPEYRFDDLGPKHLERLESMQARLEAELRLPKKFIVSASTRISAELDIAVTVARDLERSIVALTELIPEFKAEHLLAFVNRLSDYLFVLARWWENGEHTVVDYAIIE